MQHRNLCSPPAAALPQVSIFPAIHARRRRRHLVLHPFPSCASSHALRRSYLLKLKTGQSSRALYASRTGAVQQEICEEKPDEMDVDSIAALTAMGWGRAEPERRQAAASA